MKITLNDELLSLNKQFKKLGIKLYVVGGYVRDSLLGKTTLDIDICSSMTTSQILEKIKDFDIEVVNEKLGSVHFRKNGKIFEHTTFRVDYYHDNGEHTPYKVEFSDDIYTDSFRRDFSVNALYYDIQNDEIIDFFDGLTDLENKTLKTIVSPEYVFGSDGLRLLRMIRFALSLNFKIDSETFETSKEFIYQLSDISSKRIFDEIEKIFEFNNFFDAINYFKEMKAFGYILKNINTLPINKKIDALIEENDFEYLKPTSLKKYRIALFLMDIINLCYKNSYDSSVTMEGISEYVTSSENFCIKADEKEKIIETMLFFEEFDKLEDNENEKKALILDNSNNLDLIVYVAKENEKHIEVFDIYSRLKQKNIALNINDFVIKASDIINLGIKNKNITLALNDIFLYSVVYEINDKEILIKVLEKLEKEGKYD